MSGLSIRLKVDDVRLQFRLLVLCAPIATNPYQHSRRSAYISAYLHVRLKFIANSDLCILDYWVVGKDKKDCKKENNLFQLWLCTMQISTFHGAKGYHFIIELNKYHCTMQFEIILYNKADINTCENNL